MNRTWAGRESNWRGQAECLGSDPDLFFPLGGTGEPLAKALAAKEVCGTCAVRRPCLQFALETNQDTGVWGGTTEDERRSLRRTWVRAGRPKDLHLTAR
jgi:WhiB family redox-sensing transcriptional regulator